MARAQLRKVGPVGIEPTTRGLKVRGRPCHPVPGRTSECRPHRSNARCRSRSPRFVRARPFRSSASVPNPCPAGPSRARCPHPSRTPGQRDATRRPANPSDQAGHRQPLRRSPGMGHRRPDQRHRAPAVLRPAALRQHHRTPDAVTGHARRPAAQEVHRHHRPRPARTRTLRRPHRRAPRHLAPGEPSPTATTSSPPDPAATRPSQLFAVAAAPPLRPLPKTVMRLHQRRRGRLATAMAAPTRPHRPHRCAQGGRTDRAGPKATHPDTTPPHPLRHVSPADTGRRRPGRRSPDRRRLGRGGRSSRRVRDHRPPRPHRPAPRPPTPPRPPHHPVEPPQSARRTRRRRHPPRLAPHRRRHSTARDRRRPHHHQPHAPHRTRPLVERHVDTDCGCRTNATAATAGAGRGHPRR